MPEKKTLLLCNGLSGSGKTTFIEKHIDKYSIYNLKSMTTRNIRDGEQWGDKYYFVDLDVFNQIPTATTLFVNEAFWRPGVQKWMYGVPEFEINNHLGQNLVYDVIQPRYSRQLIDWFNAHGLDKYYEYKILWFLPPTNNIEIVAGRANMPNDINVRINNTCDAIDFLRVGLQPDYILKFSAEETIISDGVYKLCADISYNKPTGAMPHVKVTEHTLEMLAKLAHSNASHNADYKQMAHDYYFGR